MCVCVCVCVCVNVIHLLELCFILVLVDLQQNIH